MMKDLRNNNDGCIDSYYNSNSWAVYEYSKGRLIRCVNNQKYLLKSKIVWKLNEW